MCQVMQRQGADPAELAFFINGVISASSRKGFVREAAWPLFDR